MSSIRKQVRARIMTTMEAAVAAGLDAMSEARKVYPDVPITVITDCWSKLDVDEAEHWWRSMEKTIEGDVVNRAARIAHNAPAAETEQPPRFTDDPGLDFDPFVAPHEDDPAGQWHGDDGLALRDRFAIAALPAIQERLYSISDVAQSHDGIAETAYDLADAMMAARARS